MRIFLLYLVGLFAATEAFTITSPTEGQILDPTEPITFSWTADSSDPTTFNIVLDNSASGGLTDNIVVATDVSTSSGSYVVSTSAARTYGDGFVLKAESSTGDVIATSPTFSLAMEGGTSQTYTGTVSEGPASATNNAASASATSMDNTATATTDVQATLGGSPDSSVAGSASSTTGSNSFTTRTVSRSGSSTGTSSSSSPSATTSQNAQPKLGSRSQYAFTAAGLIAGLAALLA